MIEKCSDSSRECGVNKGDRNCLCKQKLESITNKPQKKQIISFAQENRKKKSFVHSIYSLIKKIFKIPHK